MAKYFKGQVKVADVQAEFDNIIGRINNMVDAYNSTLDLEHTDFSIGSPTLAPSGYTLSVGGMKQLFNHFDSTVHGCKVCKISDNQVKVTSGALIYGGKCYPIKDQLVGINYATKALYYNFGTGVIERVDRGAPVAGKAWVTTDLNRINNKYFGTWDEFVVDKYPTVGNMRNQITFTDGAPDNITFGETFQIQPRETIVYDESRDQVDGRYLTHIHTELNLPETFRLSLISSSDYDYALKIYFLTDGDLVFDPSVNIHFQGNPSIYGGTKLETKTLENGLKLLVYGFDIGAEPMETLENTISIDIKHYENEQTAEWDEASEQFIYRTAQIGVVGLNFGKGNDDKDIFMLEMETQGALTGSFKIVDIQPSRTFNYLNTIHNTQITGLNKYRYTIPFKKYTYLSEFASAEAFNNSSQGNFYIPYTWNWDRITLFGDEFSMTGDTGHRRYNATFMLSPLYIPKGLSIPFQYSANDFHKAREATRKMT